MEGSVILPLVMGMISIFPFLQIETAEFVVPKSIPIQNDEASTIVDFFCVYWL